MVSASQPKLIRVLLVEDKEDDFHYFRYLLQKNTINRYEVDWAPTYEEALNIIARDEHDVALFDYRLGARTGVELLREVIGKGCEIPIILLTGADNAEVDQEAAAAGAADYLSKVKLDTVHLERSIRYALRHADMVRALRESQAQLQLFMRNVPCAICIQDEPGEFLFRNEIFKQHFNSEALRHESRTVENGAPWQYEDGKNNWLVSTFPMVDTAGRRLRGVAAVNITDRIRAEEQLRRTTWLLDGILTTLPVIASRVDKNGIITESRGHGLQELGLKDSELVGRRATNLFPDGAREIERAIGGRPVSFISRVEHGGRTHYFDNYFHFDEPSGSGAIGFSVNITARVEAEATNKRQSQLLTGIMQNLPVIVGRLDSRGRVVEVAGSGLSARGITPEEMLGREFGELFPQAEEAIEEALSGEAASCSLSGRDETEEWQVEFFVFADDNEAGGAIFFGRDVTERKRLERRLLSISDSEQRRIGADLHDGLGQHLTGIACLATALRDRLRAQKSDQATNADTIAGLVNAAIDLTRALARGLCPVQVEQTGLCAALEDMAYQVQRLNAVKCEFDAIGPNVEFEPDVALHLYRIAQEATNNALKHSAAQRIVITLDTNSSPAQLTVEDNGTGFDLSALPSGGGLGLRLMDYRTAMIGGSFKISPQARGGMRVECTFPNPSYHDEKSH